MHFFFCRLCLFICVTKRHIVHLMPHYDRHVNMAKEGNISDWSQWIAVKSTQHQFSVRDYHNLSAEESLQHFLQRQAQIRNSETLTVTSPAYLTRICESGDTKSINIYGSSRSLLGLQCYNPLATMDLQGHSSRDLWVNRL